MTKKVDFRDKKYTSAKKKWDEENGKTYSGNLQLREVEVRHGGRRNVDEDEE